MGEVESTCWMSSTRVERVGQVRTCTPLARGFSLRKRADEGRMGLYCKGKKRHY